MCTHHWMINSANIGTCKNCGIVKDFNPKIALTKQEKRAVYLPFNNSFYSQGRIICQEESFVQ